MCVCRVSCVCVRVRVSCVCVVCVRVCVRVRLSGVCVVCVRVYSPTEELMNGAKCVAVPEHAYCLRAAARFDKHVESSPRDGRGP